LHWRGHPVGTAGAPALKLISARRASAMPLWEIE
jgi:hypothetical protein